MKKLRVLVLCHQELVPPASIEGLSDAEISDFRTEFDVVTALTEQGHEVACPGIGDDPDEIRDAIIEFEPDITFNLMVEFHGIAHYDQHVASYLELLEAPYTGCGPRGLTLARDKALSKTILRAAGVPVPDFHVFPRGTKTKRPRELPFPLFVKSLTEEASLGISRASIVRTERALEERVRHIHESVGTDAIAEEFIEGREFYAAILGNERLKAFPLWELHIPRLPAGEPLIATRQVKWDVNFQKRMRMQNARAKLPAAKEREIQRDAKAAYRALGLRGFARLDIRMRSDGSHFFLEANPNPDLTYGEDFAESAEAGGLNYPVLLERIIKLGLG